MIKIIICLLCFCLGWIARIVFSRKQEKKTFEEIIVFTIGGKKNEHK